jgi:hypothetical protein
VLKKVGTATYKLDLPEQSKIHPIVHVSQLKRVVKANVPVYQELPSPPEEPCYPEQILERREYIRGMIRTNQVLIQWTGMAPNLATWEVENELKTKYPLAPAWGQAAGKEGENVRNLDT